MIGSFLRYSLFFALFFAVLPLRSAENPTLENSNIYPKDINKVLVQEIEGGLQAFWSINYQVIPRLKKEGYTISVKYAKTFGTHQVSDYLGTEWKEIRNISIDSTHATIKNLSADTKYVIKVGISKEKNTVWSEPAFGLTEGSRGFWQIFILIGALGMFLYGMKIMSEGLQQAAGAKLRNLLSSLTSNRIKGVLTGFGITSIIQSSSVTTVMTVSFVNAGLMTLVQSAGVMMGANIGTTITGWIINFFGFKISIAPHALILIAIGTPLLFVGKIKMKAWGQAIVGFALLFLGLEFLKDGVSDLGADSALVRFFVNYKDIPVVSTLLFVLLGTVITMIIQSSSAAMALTMTMVAGGIIPFDVAAAMILGENIGTTITAELASSIGNVYAKRSARIHTLFNVIGVCWAILLFPFFLDGIAWAMELFGAGNPFTDTEISANTGLALFHTTFNTLNVLLLIWFVPQLIRLAELTVKSRGAADEEFHLDYIGTGIMATPDLSILEAKKEIAKFGTLTSRMSKYTQSLLFEKNANSITDLHAKIKKYEEITDRVEIEVANYLNKISEGELSEEIAGRIRGMNSIVNDLERIGDIFYQMSKALERKNIEKAWFTPEQRNRLKELFALVDEAFVVMNANLSAHHDTVVLDKAKLAEKRINEKRDELRNEHLNGLTDISVSNFRSGMIYNDLFSSLEKVGDHIINVTEAIVGKI